MASSDITIKRIGVIGAGSMGVDVALVLSYHGYNVVLKDVSDDVLSSADKKMRESLRMASMARVEWRNVSYDDLKKNISLTTKPETLSSVDMIIENVPEDLDVKQRVYMELRTVCPTNTLYAVNTSCISITKIASLMPEPGRVLGMHFMNPVTLKDMVEMIRGFHTTEATLTEAKLFLKSIKKSSVVANDMPGFIANRLSHLLMNEAAYLIQDNVGTARDIDALFRKGYGHSMGPLETADLIGLDTVVNSLNVLYTSYQDSKFRCCPLLIKMVDAGMTGRKSGEGFYKYQ